jgi:hypothetical protein
VTAAQNAAERYPQVRVVYRMPDNRMVGYDTFCIGDFGELPDVGDNLTTITDEKDFELWEVNCRHWVLEPGREGYWLLVAHPGTRTWDTDALVNHTMLVTDFHEGREAVMSDEEHLERMKSLLGYKGKKFKPKERL